MYESLISNLREHAEWARANEWESPITLGDDLEGAIEAIEALKAENARLRRERDAAVRDLHYNDACKICVGAIKEPEECDRECLTCSLNCRCKNCRDENLWQWRGPDGRGE